MRLTKKQQICKNTRTTHIDMSFGELKETPFAKKKGPPFLGLENGRVVHDPYIFSGGFSTRGGE